MALGWSWLLPGWGKQQWAEEMLCGGRRENCGANSHEEKAVFWIRGLFKYDLNPGLVGSLWERGASKGSKVNPRAMAKKEKESSMQWESLGYFRKIG